MKKLCFTLCLGLGTIIVAQAQHAVDCSYTSISGNITSNTTLHANIRYRLEGCVKVTSGNTLTIEPGTCVLAEKASNATLYISPGAFIIAKGTSTSPIVFATDQVPGYKAAGDWGGIIIGGQAGNNVPATGMISLTRNCGISAGGLNDADSSGALQFIQVHYAKYGLSLLSVGNKTVVDHIQVSEVSKNAFEFMGGTVNAKYLASLNAHQSDFLATYGYRGNIQFGLGLRKDATAHDAGKSDGILIQNDPAASSNAPYTRPVFSNMTIIGPSLCNTGTLSTDFRDALRFQGYSRGSVYNSVMTNWTGNGIYIDPYATANTATDLLNCSSNSFSANGQDYDPVSSWVSSCETNMPNWIEGLGALPCDESGTQLNGFGATGYDATGICSSATPDFRLGGSTAMDIPDFSASDLGNAFFNTSFGYRGAFDPSTNWVAGWTNFDAQAADYCTAFRTLKGIHNEAAKKIQNVAVAPNPAVGNTYASFTSTRTGSTRIEVIDKVNGKVVKTISVNAPVGDQHIRLDLDGLQVGSYILRIKTPDGNIQFSQVMLAN